MLLGDEVEDALAGLLVEVTGRLVGQQHTRVVHKRAGDRHALTLAAGEFTWPVLQPMAEAEGVQQLRTATAQLADPAVVLPSVQPDQGRQQRVLQDVEFAQQVVELEDEPDRTIAIVVARPPRSRRQRLVFEENLTAVGIGSVEVTQQVKQCALARPRRAEHGNPLAFIDPQRRPVEHGHVHPPQPVGLGQVLGDQ